MAFSGSTCCSNSVGKFITLQKHRPLVILLLCLTNTSSTWLCPVFILQIKIFTYFSFIISLIYLYKCIDDCSQVCPNFLPLFSSCRETNINCLMSSLSSALIRIIFSHPQMKSPTKHVVGITVFTQVRKPDSSRGSQ